MSFDLLRRLILWFTRVLSRRDKNRELSIKAPLPDKPPESAKGPPTDQPITPSKKPTKTPISPVEKTTEIASGHGELSSKEEETTKEPQELLTNTKVPGERPEEDVRSDETPLESKIPVTKEETKGKADTEQDKVKVKEKEKKASKPRKPYIVKPPTEKGRERRTPSQDSKRSSRWKVGREIDLGGVQRRLQKSRRATPQQAKGQQPQKEQKKDALTRVLSPFVELNLNNARVFLVVPGQEISADGKEIGYPQKIKYQMELNGEKRTLGVAAITRDGNRICTDEIRMEVNNPIKNLRVIYPDELEGRDYNYNHTNEMLYTFIASGNNSARMHYLYDEEGKLNPPPKRDVWVLLKEGFSINNDVDVIEEIWIWESFQPLRINLKGINELSMVNGSTGVEDVIPCNACFSIEGEGLIEDDFAGHAPLFAGERIQINPVSQSPSAWTVWIQNKCAGHRIAEDCWTGAEPLELEVPSRLPCDCGEFQIDICERGGSVPVDTLFFRYVSGLQLDYNKALALPDPFQGHNHATVKMFLENGGRDFWLSADKNIQSRGEWHHIEMLPNEDTLNLHITKKDNSESVTRLKVTLPRLKWRIAGKQDWNDQLFRVEKNELVTGTDRYLEVNTNDRFNKYDVLATLEAGGLTLQEEKSTRKGQVHTIWLNKFYETIYKNRGKVNLKSEIREKSGQLVGKIEVIHFYDIEEADQHEAPRQVSGKNFKTLGEKINKKCLVRRTVIRPKVKCARGMRFGKGFSQQEIVKAGIYSNGLRGLNIRLDKRRKSTHSHNIETLKKLIKVKKDGN
jgi:ribosomal protein L13E